MAHKSDSTRSLCVDKCTYQTREWDRHLELTAENNYAVVELAISYNYQTHATVSTRWITRREYGSVGCFYVIKLGDLEEMLSSHPQAFRDGDQELKHRVFEFSLARLPEAQCYFKCKLLSYGLVSSNERVGC
jgi:hypothetical protein